MMRKYIYSVLAFLIGVFAYGQIDTTVSLISKIDAFPQFELEDGNEIMIMGYSETIGGALNIPSPTLVFKEGDSVELELWNLSQGAPHTIHLHGLDVNQENDGVPSLSFSLAHDETGSYKFKAPHPGTYIYHCHETSVVHVQAGMYGLLIVKPQSSDTLTWESGYSFHKDYAWMTSEIDTNWHHDTIINMNHDPNDMMHTILDYKPQHFLINGKSANQLNTSNDGIKGSVNEVIYLRLANIGYYGNTFKFPDALNTQIIDSDGRPLPSVLNQDSIVILPGERYGVLLQPSQEFQGAINIEYFSLNTELVEQTEAIQVDVEGFLQLDELEEIDFKIHPNPSNGKFMVVLDENLSGTSQIQVLNAQGILLDQIEVVSTHQEINSELLKAGVYFISIVNDNQTKTKRIVIY